MLLKNIKETSCPVCGCSIVVEEKIETGTDGKIRVHTNGDRWETRRFSCGQVLEYIPNYRSIEKSSYYVCQNDIELIEKKKKRALANEYLYHVITSLDVDNEFKESLQSAIYYK